jgi:hypothetical protein
VTGHEPRSETVTERRSETTTKRLLEVVPIEGAAAADLGVNVGEPGPAALTEGRGLPGAWEPEAMASGASLGTEDSERWGSVGEEHSQGDKKALDDVGLGCNKRRTVWSLNISFVIFKH